MVACRAALLVLLSVSCCLLAVCNARSAAAADGGAQPEWQQQQAEGSSQQQQQQQQAEALFISSPSCRALPTKATSSADSAGRLWGTAHGAPCAFKDAAGHALFYAGYEPGSWLHTAACSMPAFSSNSVTDSKLRTWGWEASGALCAFKDDQQLPIPQQRSYVMLSWPEAPTCKETPQPTADNAVPDKFGCLWGWQLDRNCAFREAETNQPLYYAGYKGACDAAGSVARAAEFNAAGGTPGVGEPGRQLPGQDAPSMVTGMGCIGQKGAVGGAIRPCTEANVPVNFGPGPA